MAATPENATSDISNDSVFVDDDEIKFGFQREEMYTKILSQSAPPYERHVFLVFQTHQDWRPYFDFPSSHPLLKRLYDDIKAREDDIQSLFTICEGGDVTGLTNGDVLIFPDMIKYRGLEESNIDSFVEEVLVNGGPWNSATAEVVTGSYVFVCSHKSRDKRCGVCGPALVKKFNTEIEVKGLKDQVFVSPCSHIGRHKYAGNLIIYSADEDGKVSGHWYGYVTPDDVTQLLEQHIEKGDIIKRIWRGQMCIKKTEEVVEQSRPNRNDIKASETDNIKKEGKKVLHFFTRKWEQHEIFTAAAVVGAVATVAVAHSLYKRSR